MSGERSGAVLLLQEREPKRLLGSMISIIDATGAGWVQGSFFNDSLAMRFSAANEACSLAMDADVALSLAGILGVLVAQISYLRDLGTSWAFNPSQSSTIVATMGQGPKASLTLSWRKGAERVSMTEIDDQIEWRLGEDIALEVAVGILRELGKKAALG